MKDPVDRAFTAFMVIIIAAATVLSIGGVIDMAAWLALDLIKYWHEPVSYTHLTLPTNREV